VGNTFGYVYGSKEGPLVVAEGHLDTVFSLDTPLEIKEVNGRIYCPGIGDDTAALATVLSVVRAIRHAGLKPCGTLMLGGTVGEEAPGHARGVRHLMDTRKDDIDAYVAVETCWTYRINRGAVACRRFELIFRGPGGHAWNAYGLPSPIHAAGRAIASIADIVPPSSPKTICNVGVISGGTSVNSIANEATIYIDTRSTCMEERDKIGDLIVKFAHKAVEDENRRHPDKGKVTVEVRVYGIKPGGELPEDAEIIQIASAATKAVGVEPRILEAASTNMNFPLALGIPSVCIGAGGDSANQHALDEWFDPTDSYTGPQKCLLMLFALAGLEGVTPAICKKRNPPKA
jgi:acetylornithine deacetylase/succinyl-diaminopimelate desuccinylase-like protein